MMNRIYFDFNDREAIATWLEARPAGTWHVLIGTDAQEATVADAVAAVAVACGKETVQWAVDKMQRDEMVVRVSPTLDIPSGVSLPNDH